MGLIFQRYYLVRCTKQEIGPECSFKDWYWRWNSNTLATWCEELTHWKRLWCWERLKAGGKGDDRGWDGWMAWPTQWTWVWVNSGSWWWTGRPGVLQSRVTHDWVTKLNWTELSRKEQTANEELCYELGFGCGWLPFTHTFQRAEAQGSRLVKCSCLWSNFHIFLKTFYLCYVKSSSKKQLSKASFAN